MLNCIPFLTREPVHAFSIGIVYPLPFGYVYHGEIMKRVFIRVWNG